jgi:predicted permease
MLLAGAGLLIKSFFRLQEVDPGFKPEGVITLRIALSEMRYARPEQVREFFRELIERTSRLPGVKAVGGVSDLPLSGSGSSGTTTVDSQAVSGEERSPEADWRIVTPGYFSAMSIPLLRGRYFTDADTADAAPVAIIDESMAQTYWPGEDPIGKRLHPGGQGANAPWMTIVGVVGHVRYATLEARSRVELYWPYAQDPGATMGFAVRTSLDPGSLAKSIEREVINIDPDQPVAMVRTMDQLLGESLARRRFLTFLLLVFAGCALALAAVGIYGVISCGVTQRRHEMGIRMALGATRCGVLGLVLGESLWLSFAGIGTGLAGSFVLARFAAGLLFDVKPADPATYFTVAAFLFVVALGASALPAYRATRVDPIEVLRTE